MIILTGCDGYMGWPTMLELAKTFQDERIVGIDNLGRRRWVEEVGSSSAIPILPMEKRINVAHEIGYTNLSFIRGDLRDRQFVDQIIKTFKPRVVVHLAAQPSAPYSQLSGERAHYTQENNCTMTRNLLWALKEEGLKETHFIETTTTGVYGAPNLFIPEGFIEVIDKKGNKDKLLYPCIASSWYHVSKGFNVINMWLMAAQTGVPVTDLRTSIVYGIDTEETAKDERLATRFDVDFFFGTLFNRWCAQVIANYPLTVYGSGNQIKPFISLEDTARSIVKAVEKGNSSGYKVYNQLTEVVKIKYMAEQFNIASEKILGKKVGINFVPNPRKEAESAEYDFENKEFLKLLGKPKKSMAGEIPKLLERLSKYSSRIIALKDRFLPKQS
jgi:nucleoside-diphosphate-sugar epimerase